MRRRDLQCDPTHNTPNGTTSRRGYGKRPRCSTDLKESPMRSSQGEAVTIAFSRRSAPPPFLMRARPGLISSASSVVRASTRARRSSSSPMSPVPRNGHPRTRARAACRRTPRRCGPRKAPACRNCSRRRMTPGTKRWFPMVRGSAAWNSSANSGGVSLRDKPQPPSCSVVAAGWRGKRSKGRRGFSVTISSPCG